MIVKFDGGFVLSVAPVTLHQVEAGKVLGDEPPLVLVQIEKVVQAWTGNVFRVAFLLSEERVRATYDALGAVLKEMEGRRT